MDDRPKSGPRSSDEQKRRALEHLRTRQRVIEEMIEARIYSVAKHDGADHEYRTGMRKTISALVAYTLAAMESPAGERPEPIPTEAVEQVRRAARRGISIDVVLCRYLAADNVLGEFVAQEIHNNHISPAITVELRRTQERLLERLTSALRQEFNQERERAERSPEQQCTELILRLLQGDLSVASELDYDFDGVWHLGLVATGGKADQLVRAVADALSCQLLRATVGDDAVVAWLARSQRQDSSYIHRVLPPGGTSGGRLAAGESRPGLLGWLATYQEAQAALLVAMQSPPGVTRFADDPLLAMMLQNPNLAESFIDTEVGALDPAQRDMLHTYYQTGCGATPTAEALDIHRHTVEHRLTEIDALVKRPIRARNAEIDLALRLARLPCFRQVEVLGRDWHDSKRQNRTRS